MSVTAALGAAAFAGGRAPRRVASELASAGDGMATQPPERVVTDAEFEEVTIDELQSGMQSGEYTSAALVDAYLARIAALDQAGPRLDAVIEVNPDALAIAERLDEERTTRGARGPLHGIPILIKDNIDTADRMKTSAGSLALADGAAARDAFIVQRLRDAGAVLLGKTNLSEWAGFRSVRATSGWSARGGLTRNPYVLDRSPCGSSSGTGAAIAANLAVAGIGTETDGSIVSPSSANCLVGIKPTVGLWSRTGLVPISKTLDTAGPMCRTVRDAAILLGAIAGVDPRDGATTEGRGANAAVSFSKSTSWMPWSRSLVDRRGSPIS